MSSFYSCLNIDRQKFGAVVWQGHRGGYGTDSHDENHPREVIVAAFLNFNEAVDFAIKAQESADAYCKTEGYPNKGYYWAERTSDNTLRATQD